MKNIIWHFFHNGLHYLEWFDGKRNHLKRLTQDEYDDIMFDIECI